jgi:hypothetical protein
VTTTIGQYLSIENNLARYQKLTADQPAVKTATAYYQANIGKVTSISQFVGNYRLLSYALQAYGLGDQINHTALITQVLQQGTTSSKALANTLPNPAWKAFATAFNFKATGASAPASSASVATTTADYDEQQLEEQQGESDPGVQLALYFKRVAPTVTSGYSVLADENLTEVVQTIFGLPATSTVSELDKEATAIGKLAPTADLQNPTKLNTLVERFAAAYDAKYGPGSNSGATPLTVNDGNAGSTTSPASTVLSGVVSGLSSSLASLSSYTPAISPALLASLPLGG